MHHEADASLSDTIRRLCEAMDKRPTSVGVIGWTYLALGALMMLLGIVVLICVTLLRGAGTAESDYLIPAAIGTLELDIPSLLQAVMPITWITIAIGAAIMWASGAFLRLRPWARAAVEAITWLGIIHNVWLGLVFWRLLDDLGPTLQATGIISAFLIAVLFNLPLLAMIESLRRREVRAQFGAEEKRITDKE